MHSTGGITGTSLISSPTQQYFPAKRIHSTHSSSSLSGIDVRELTHTFQELNNNFKRNIKVLTDIKDYMIKVCEKQDTRPADDSLGLHKLDRVRLKFHFYHNPSCQSF
ncbi:unnamed protein product [Rotaria socialis]|uniref:Uncharacterized protein n=1 Tax=Rotaria socialis TaxID=392032 RepID=A0A817S9U4_9BILA|nr:unnamed protein product [Rotaria socialis]CAF3439281.1 unnamed protein product [Rotaria socialis]CAF4308939.1 unnamed protein product [Rotaria socialis]CAF4348859.1 unnamed protein product [Rotaria socialis]